MSIDYNTEADGDWYDFDDFDDFDDMDVCESCGGDGIGEGCPDRIACCDEEFCHSCLGSGNAPYSAAVSSEGRTEQ